MCFAGYQPYCLAPSHRYMGLRCPGRQRAQPPAATEAEPLLPQQGQLWHCEACGAHYYADPLPARPERVATRAVPARNERARPARERIAAAGERRARLARALSLDRNARLSRSRAIRLKFVTAARRIIHLLKLRRKWAAYGRILQQLPRAYLWDGLERRGGVLVRHRPAADNKGKGKRVVHTFPPKGKGAKGAR